MGKTDISKLYLDQDGYNQYLEEIETLKQRLLEHHTSKGEAYSSSAGDGWHDNFDFEENVRVEKMLLGQLRDKTNKLNDIVIVEKIMDIDDSIIDINDLVRLSLVFGENYIETNIYKLVASSLPEESSEYINISINSPIGSAIYGKKVGDLTAYNVEKNIFGVKIEEKITLSRKEKIIK